jgi:hypothetical protein
MNEYPRGYLPEAVGATKYMEKSPFVQGFLAGLKGMLLGAPAGAAVQAIRGGSPLTGAIIGGLGAGLLSGIGKSLEQKMENINVEEGMRYHIEQLKSREPLVFMPPPSIFGPVFRRFHAREHGRI